MICKSDSITILVRNSNNFSPIDKEYHLKSWINDIKELSFEVFCPILKDNDTINLHQITDIN